MPINVTIAQIHAIAELDNAGEASEITLHQVASAAEVYATIDEHTYVVTHEGETERAERPQEMPDL